MLDLSRVKSKETIVIVQEDKYPDTAVLTTLPVIENKRPTIKLNRKAMELLGVNDSANRLIMFSEYNISLTENETEYDSIIGVVSDATVKGPKKQYRSYQIHTNTRCVKSTEIHKAIRELFELSGKESHNFTINSVNGLEGAFTLSHLEDSSEDDTVSVEVEFNKGEKIAIEQQ